MEAVASINRACPGCALVCRIISATNCLSSVGADLESVSPNICNLQLFFFDLTVDSGHLTTNYRYMLTHK
jgi:hypothetical protein